MDLPPGVAIRFVMKMVDADARAIVFDHAVDGFRAIDCREDICVGFIAHDVRGELVVPSFRVGRDHALGLLRLGEEKPVVPVSCEFPVGSLQMLKDWEAVDENQPLYCLRVVHRHTECRQASAVMANQEEFVIA